MQMQKHRRMSSSQSKREQRGEKTDDRESSVTLYTERKHHTFVSSKLKPYAFSLIL